MNVSLFTSEIPILKLLFLRVFFPICVCIHPNVKHTKKIDRRSFSIELQKNRDSQDRFICIVIECIRMFCSFSHSFAIRWFRCTLFYISCSTKWLHKKWIKCKTGMERTIAKQHIRYLFAEEKIHLLNMHLCMYVLMCVRVPVWVITPTKAHVFFQC